MSRETTNRWRIRPHEGREPAPGTRPSSGDASRSEMDSACAYCHAPRADAQAGWRLDRNYLVVQTGR